MSNLFTRKPVQVEDLPNKYEKLGFKHNPFPVDPAVKPYSIDERENGSIYLKQLRQNEIDQFSEVVIEKPNKISLLMDYAAFRGRGIGKTAFLNYIKKDINADFGNSISKGQKVLYSIYICPGGEKKERKFWHIAKLIYDALENENCLLMAFCRMRALTGLISEGILNQINNTNFEKTLANDEWLNNQGINVTELNTQVSNVLNSTGLNINLNAIQFFDNSFERFKSGFGIENTDSYWRNEGLKLVFSTLAKVLRAADISNCIILFDEAEKIITAQNFSERREFCDSLRACFIDGLYSNINLSLFKILITIHPNSQELLLPHWGASGLERFSELGGDKAKENTIFFAPLKDVNMGISLAVEYLNRARIIINNGNIAPFDEKALIAALNKTDGIPGRYLKLLYFVIEKACSEDWTTINAEQIENIWKNELSTELLKKDTDTGILPETKTKLTDD